MIKNYFKIAWRNLIKNKGYGAINIGGLAVGMAVAMLIGLWIWDELSFNKYHKNYDRIAQVMQSTNNGGNIQTLPYTPYPLAEAIRKEYGSSFKEVVLSTGIWQQTLNAAQKNLSSTGVYIEPGATGLLELNMLSGVRDGLKDPNSIMLSEELAIAFFGEGNAIGNTIKINSSFSVKVTGVFKNLPKKATFHNVKFMIPWQHFYNNADWVKNMEDPWRSNAFFIYVQLAEHADIDKVSASIKDVRLNHVNKDLAKQKPQLLLHPMRKWHLYDEFKNGVNTGGLIQYLWLFGIIGVFVLLLACINFINLSTARSLKRAKEVGIRKTVGSFRRQLIYQFFSESLLYVIIAFLFSLLFVQLSVSLFNQVAAKQINILWSNPLFWFFSLLLCLATGIVAGMYPAIYLSAFKPIKVLKGNFYSSRSAAAPRKVLVMLQFTASILLIIGTLVVFKQIEFAKNRPVGYDRNGLVMIYGPGVELNKHFEVIKSGLKNSGVIVDMTKSNAPATGINATNTGVSWKGKDPQLAVEFPNTSIGYDYGKTVGWQFIDGRDFSRDFLTDSAGFILNESAAKFMGFKNPVGETVIWDQHPFKVIGVIKDMVMESPYAPVRPSLYHFSSEPDNVIIAKINPKTSTSEALRQLETMYKKYNPDNPFNYQFADEEYDRKFGDEERIAKLSRFFAILAIFISCLGLFGLASFTAEQRMKEIGVRKVLGASALNVWHLLSKEFIVLVFISFLIAIPSAYYFMQNWLQKYDYRTQIPWWIFAIAGSGTLLMTLLTVSLHAIKAAIANPVKSLRTE
jgi:putative ABC transport system permease protein